MNSEKPGEKELIALLHAVLYAFQNALDDVDRKVCFYVSRKLPDILGKFGFKIDPEKSPEENANLIIGLVEETGYVEDAFTEREDERTFVVNIGKCTLAESGVHETLKPKRAYCPFAIIVAGVLQEIFDDNVIVSPSEFTEKGSVTIIKRYRHAIL